MLLLLFKYNPVPVTSGKPRHGSEPDVLCASWLQSREGCLPRSPLIVRQHRWGVGGCGPGIHVSDLHVSLSVPESRVYLKIHQINASEDACADFSDTHKARSGFFDTVKTDVGSIFGLQQGEGFREGPERVFQQ